MATTKGCLLASTNSGCKATYASGGATNILLKDGMTRALVVRFGTVKSAANLKFFLNLYDSDDCDYLDKIGIDEGHEDNDIPMDEEIKSDKPHHATPAAWAYMEQPLEFRIPNPMEMMEPNANIHDEFDK
ncbi:hypothetical protein RJ639_016314 [Escallonia herrerae]|uniref:Uncharacterized protein n=1 Tax=Escallonia herrerae TaxID=1293975 RepID=A0AA88VGP3_9ASTE|nr:hypothetical protein RJ639_016314 [Escallonia herrerae]